MKNKPDFANHVATTNSLPLTDETNGVMSYGQPVTKLNCDSLG